MASLTVFYWLLVAIIAIAIVARRTGVAPPIFWVFGGLALSVIPGLPDIELLPELVFVLFLPPLLFSDSWGQSFREAKKMARAIFMLAVGLVLFTSTIVALVAHAMIPGFSLALGFVLGAILAPTDTIAAAAITSTVRVPGRITTVLDGESLVNDASALIAYRFAIAAVVTGAFSLIQASLQFFIVAIGGAAFGLGAGWLFVKLQVLLRRHDLGEPLIVNTIFLMTPFAVYLGAESVHVSGVLAVVVAGVYLSSQASRILSPETRVQAWGVWVLLDYILNGVVFVLMGLQLRHIAKASSTLPLPQLIFYGSVISVVVIVVRILWVFPGTYFPRMLSRKIRDTEVRPPWQWTSIVAWTGMRGVVSLAAALALPVNVAPGVPFPGRDIIVFITFCVIMATLVVQGLTLPILIRKLGVTDDGKADIEEAQARLYAAHKALERVEELAQEEHMRDQAASAERLRAYYNERLHHFNIRLYDLTEGSGEDHTKQHRLRDMALAAERDAIAELRRNHMISDEVLNRVEGDIDFTALNEE